MDDELYKELEWELNKLRDSISGVLFFLGFMPILLGGVSILNLLGFNLKGSVLTFSRVAAWTFFAVVISIPMILYILNDSIGEIEKKMKLIHCRK